MGHPFFHLTFVHLMAIFLVQALLAVNAACPHQENGLDKGARLCGDINTTKEQCTVQLGCCWSTNSSTTQESSGTCYAPSNNTTPNSENCAVYNGSVCGVFLNQSLWEYRWKPRYIDSIVGLNQTETTISIFLKFLDNVEDLECKKIIQTLLCQYTLAPCNDKGKEIPYCREDCEELFLQCEKPMIEILGAAKVILNQRPPSKRHIGFPNCTRLKYRHEYPKNDKEKCLHFGIFDFSKENSSSSVGYCIIYKRELCYDSFNVTMVEYRDSPRFVDRKLGLKRTEEIIKKFLGVIDAMESKDEWCKTMIRSLVCQYAFIPCDAKGNPRQVCREDCEALFQTCEKPMSEVMGAAKYLFGHDKVMFFHIGLPNCTKLKYEKDLFNTTCFHFGVFDLTRRIESRPSKVVTVAASSSAAIVVVVLLVVGAMIICRKRRKSLGIKRGYQGVTFTAVSMRDRLRADTLRMLDESKLKSLFNLDDVMQYPLDRVEYVKDLGQGNFGNVFQGRAYGLVGEKPDTEIMVAVKTLKEGSSKETKESFFQEVAMMSLLNHENIVQLLAVSTEEEPFGMIFEFMNLGDLNHYLRNAGPFSELTSSADNKKVILMQEDLLAICMQITLGMEHLQILRFVHRDLATRNLLVGDNGDGLVVKIADFGMSRDIYASDYYKVEGQAALPIRWLPPEALLYGKFTVESDVYTYGVVLWEVYTFALQPYYGYTNDQVVDFIKKGVHLGKPEECPGFIYTIMKSCWKKDPAQRPNFTTILAMLNQSQEVLSLKSGGGTLPRTSENASVEGFDNPANQLYQNTAGDAQGDKGEYCRPGMSGFTNPGFAPSSPTNLNPDAITTFPSIDIPASIDSPASTGCHASYVNVAPTRDTGVEPTKMEDQTHDTRESKVSFLCALDNHEPVLDDDEVQV